MNPLVNEILTGTFIVLFLVLYVRHHWLALTVKQNNLILQEFYNYFQQGFTIISESELHMMTNEEEDNHASIVEWDDAGKTQAKAKK